MTKPAGGLRDRRRPDVMELLARARPASLNSGQDPQQRAAEIARLAATGTAAAGATTARPLAGGSTAAGPAGLGPAGLGLAGAGPEPAVPRPARRLPGA